MSSEEHAAEDRSRDHDVYCPSAQPDMPGAVVFGVVAGTANEPYVRYLDQLVPVTPEVTDLAQPVEPTEVFRIGAPCAGSRCRHFDGAQCSLVQRITRLLPPEAGNLPACRLRPRCRWWQEQGEEACHRCPLVVTLQHHPSPDVVEVARPPDESRPDRAP